MTDEEKDAEIQRLRTAVDHLAEQVCYEKFWHERTRQQLQEAETTIESLRQRLADTKGERDRYRAALDAAQAKLSANEATYVAGQ